MTFGQLYYTSCRTGLSGHPGYQFNAATPGVAPDVMRDVEALTAYEPPRSLQPGSDLDAYPVNLCHVPGETTLVANVVFVGEDYSRRSGNYFAHALVTEDPRRDLGDRPPIELWRSPGWADRPVDGTDLPELAGLPRAAGGITPASVADFLAESGTDHHLGVMLTAAELAIRDGERKLVIIAEDSDTVARWIAALSYALPDDCVRSMSFMTYSGQPRFSRAAVVGALPDVDIDRGSGFDRYYLFDLVADRATELPVHPLARLLAHVGVAGCPDLWQRVDALDTRRTGAGAGFAELYPLAVAAAELPDGAAVDLDPLALLTWLERAGGQWDPPVLTAVGSAALAALTHDRVSTVDPLARLAAVMDAVGLSDLLDRAEAAIVDVILGDPRGDGGGWPTLRGAPARAYATDELNRRLPDLSPDIALTLLTWADRAGLRLNNQVMFHIGQTVVGPALLDATGATVAGTLRSSVAVREGAVKHVAAVADKDPDRVIEFLAGPTADLLSLDDSELDVHPALAEVAVLADVRRGTVTPLKALPTIARRRLAADRVPTVEAALLRRLWPSGRWTHDEAIAVTEWLDADGADVSERVVIDWLSAGVLDPVSLSDVDNYLRHKELCETLYMSGVFHELGSRARGRIETLRSADTDVDNLLKTKGQSQFDRRLGELHRHMSAGSPTFRQRVEDELIRGHRRIPAHFQALVVTRFSTYRKRLFAEQSDLVAEHDTLDHAAFLWCVRYELALNRSRTALADLDAQFLPNLRKLRKRDLRRLQEVLGKQLPGAAATFAQWTRTAESNGLIGRLARKVWSRGDDVDDEPKPESGKRT